jgi:radical SAM superfamily enzyme YgiQ (UPF0313 family)
MADIVLTTLNARFAHTSFGLRYLLSNLGPLADRARILEFEIKQRPVDIAEAILAETPRIVGLGVYIWNVGPATELVRILKALAPSLTIILGGPEVSHETEAQEICLSADHVITGEGDLVFARTCTQILSGRQPPAKVLPAPIPAVTDLILPYRLYTDSDIAYRTLYVEASRGCPFSCEFCLSSLDIPVRQFQLDGFLAELRSLLDRGARQLKFVDRTFNLVESAGGRVLQFLLEQYRPGHFFHFEIVPDRLPESLRGIIKQFPRGALQFEVGVQTFNEEVASRISRRQNYLRLEENLRFLRQQTGVHVHADLIVGLPGESLESFAAGFDRLIKLGPQEIQVGMLKRLRGAPISRHTPDWEMVYSPLAPYEILCNKLIDFGTMQRLRRFARYWDLVGNSGNFSATVPLLWSTEKTTSPFFAFLAFSDWLFARTRRTDSIALSALMELVFEYLTEPLSQPPPAVALLLWRDYHRGGRSDKPSFLSAFLPSEPRAKQTPLPGGLPKRQSRHLG